MAEEYRDVHNNISKQYENYLKVIKKSSMSDYQKKKIDKFVLDLKLGKDGAKVRERRIVNYLMFLIKLHKYFGKDIDNVTENEATTFYQDLHDDKIRRDNGAPYSVATKDMFTRTFKRYWGWKIGDRKDKKYRKIAGWMKEDYKKSNKKAITFEQAELCIRKSDSRRNKCLFMTGFDSGGRIEELLNVRICDLIKSKKDKFWMLHLRGTKTDLADRQISLPLATKHINDWLKEHPTKEEKDFLFPINYDNARKIIREMAKKALALSLTPHELRHSSATFYIQKFGAENVGGFYYRYGWKFGSKVAEGYIKISLLGGEIGQEKVVNVVENDRVEKLETELEDMRSDMEAMKAMRAESDKVMKELLKLKVKK